jgi:hypothetical protein
MSGGHIYADAPPAAPGLSGASIFDRLTLCGGGGMVDAEASKASVREGVWVRLPPAALYGSCLRMVYQPSGTLCQVPATKLRIQVTLDSELAAAVAEFGGAEPCSRAVRDLALRGAEAIRAERTARRDAIEHLRRIATGEDDRYDFAISEQLHASR